MHLPIVRVLIIDAEQPVLSGYVCRAQYRPPGGGEPVGERAIGRGRAVGALPVHIRGTEGRAHVVRIGIVQLEPLGAVEGGSHPEAFVEAPDHANLHIHAVARGGQVLLVCEFLQVKGFIQGRLRMCRGPLVPMPGDADGQADIEPIHVVARIKKGRIGRGTVRVDRVRLVRFRAEGDLARVCVQYRIGCWINGISVVGQS